MTKAKLFCFKHQDYRGETPPALSCTTCCSMYISKIKELRKSDFDPRRWLSDLKDKAINAKSSQQ